MLKRMGCAQGRKIGKVNIHMGSTQKYRILHRIQNNIHRIQNT